MGTPSGHTIYSAIVTIRLLHFSHKLSSSADADQQVAELILAHPVARLDHGGAVELLEDRRAFEGRVERQAVAGVDRRWLPAVAKPDSAFAGLRRLERGAALAGGEGGERDL